MSRGDMMWCCYWRKQIMYRALLFLPLIALVLSGCSLRMEQEVRAIEDKFEEEYIDTRSELNDIHKANSIRYVSAEKKVILQAALASLLELGFHINNQSVELGVLSGTADKSAAFLDSEILREDQKYRDKLISIIYQEYSGCCVGLQGETIAKLTASAINRMLSSISVNVMVIERESDSQVSVAVTYSSSQGKADYPYDNWVQNGMIIGVNHEYTLPPRVLRITYKRIWDGIEKQLFLQNIILNR